MYSSKRRRGHSPGHLLSLSQLLEGMSEHFFQPKSFSTTLFIEPFRLVLLFNLLSSHPLVSSFRLNLSSYITFFNLSSYIAFLNLS